MTGWFDVETEVFGSKKSIWKHMNVNFDLIQELYERLYLQWLTELKHETFRCMIEPCGNWMRWSDLRNSVSITPHSVVHLESFFFNWTIVVLLRNFVAVECMFRITIFQTLNPNVWSLYLQIRKKLKFKRKNISVLYKPVSRVQWLWPMKLIYTYIRIFFCKCSWKKKVFFKKK